jgi:hypothetical protein
MKTREMVLIFALTSALSLAVASTPARHTQSASSLGSSVAVTTSGGSLSLPTVGLLQQQPPPVQPAPEQKDVDVTVKTETREWYVSPVWLAIGILAAIVLVLLIAMAVRGSGGGGETTTRIVHESQE